MINTLCHSIYSIKKEEMINTDKEFYSSPYYFFLRDKGKDYSLYFSAEETLVEARKKDEMVKVPKEKVKHVKAYLEKLLKSKKKKSTKDMKGEIEELVNLDGALSNSKIPILDPKLHPRKTMDQTVAAARITNDPISRGYRTYYGESVEEEVSEIDMSKAFGYEETEDMDGKETFDYMVKKLDMDPDEAKDRTEQQGKDPSGKKDKKSKFYKDKNFITRATLSEIQKQKAIKMVEDILMKKKNSDNSEVGEKKKEAGEEEKKELPKVIKKNFDTLLKQIEKHGLSKKDIIKLLDSE
jgi:hypothetical protein